ncbi:MAG TPA: S-layer homology domain-containing protein, partial [Bacillota bacterium]|nr:S-layer homology domain-containing protein [Bacillota bacterium]
NYVESAIDQKLINKSSDHLNPEEKITREELADLIVRALGYQNLLEVNDLFTIDLKDASTLKNPAAAELVTKLGIIDTIEGNFQSDQHVSRGEAASAFYRYLTKRNLFVPFK